MNDDRVRRDYLSIPDAAHLFGYERHGTALWRAAKDGKIEHVRIGRDYLLKRSSVQAYVERPRRSWTNRPLGEREAANALS
jgi:excisionase family DNA binding protein